MTIPLASGLDAFALFYREARIVADLARARSSASSTTAGPLNKYSGEWQM